MSNEVKVSVIIPVYNVEKYLDRCIQSVLNQTLKEIEIILVDDGSPDNCPQMCDEYAKKDSRIKVIHKKNQGLGFARNSGMEIATGEYIAFVDSDDFVDKDMYEEMYDRIKKDNSDMLITNFYEFDTEKKIKLEKKVISSSRVINKEEVKKVVFQMLGIDPRKKELEDIGMSVWKNIYSKKFLDKNNIKFCSEREFVSEDAIFHLMSIPKMKKISLLSKPYYYYCKNREDSLSSTFRESKFEEYKKLLKKEYEILRLEKMLEEGKYYVTTTFLGNIRAHIKQLAITSCSLKRKKELIQKIVNDELLQDVLKWYPYEKTSIKQKIFSIALKKKFVNCILILGKLQSMR